MSEKRRSPRRQAEAVGYGVGGKREGAAFHHGWVSSPDRARDTQTDEIVALKKVRMDKEKDGERDWDVGRQPLPAQRGRAGRCRLAGAP